MRYSQQDEILFKVLLGISLCFPLLAVTAGGTGNGMPGASSQGSFVKSISPSYINWHSEYYETVHCLEEHESRHNPNAYNPYDIDGKEKFGVLQFGRNTFQEFCVEEYHYRDEIMNPVIQRNCAAQMIRDGYIKRWGTYKQCQHLLSP